MWSSDELIVPNWNRAVALGVSLNVDTDFRIPIHL